MAKTTQVIDPGRVYPRAHDGPKDADMLPPDYLSVASVLFAFAAISLNVRLLAWAATFSLLSSLLTRGKSDFDTLQTAISTVVTGVVLYFVYVDPLST